MWRVNSISMQQLFGAVADLGRSYFQRPNGGPQTPLGSIEWLCRELLSHRGEASGTALAREVAQAIAAMAGEERVAFLTLLADAFGPDAVALSAAARVYLDAPSVANCLALGTAIESPRQALLRRLNMAPGGTAAIVGLRADLLRAVREQPRSRPSRRTSSTSWHRGSTVASWSSSRSTGTRRRRSWRS